MAAEQLVCVWKWDQPKFDDLKTLFSIFINKNMVILWA